MPQAILHILIPLVLVALYKDFHEKKHWKGSFPLHYVLIAGLAGIIPDLDVAVYWVGNILFGWSLEAIHRTASHTVFVPLAFCILAYATRNVRIRFIRTHHLKLKIIFLLCAFGSMMHVILDGIFGGTIMPFYPFSSYALGFDLAGRLPEHLGSILVPTLEAALLVLWLTWLEIKHKVSDFI